MPGNCSLSTHQCAAPPGDPSISASATRSTTRTSAWMVGAARRSRPSPAVSTWYVDRRTKNEQRNTWRWHRGRHRRAAVFAITAGPVTVPRIRDLHWTDATDVNAASSSLESTARCRGARIHALRRQSRAQLATLLVGCADRKGIVASLAQLLYGHGANILDADQHTDPSTGMFFQRLRFDLVDARHRPRRARGAARARSPSASAWTGASLRRSHAARRDLRARSRSTASTTCCIRHRAGELPCEIAMVISNHPDAAPIARALRRAVPSPAGHAETKRAQEAADARRCSTAQASI